MAIGRKAARQQGEHLTEDQILEPIADDPGVGVAAHPHPVEEGIALGVGGESGAAEEQPEALEGVLVSQRLEQIHLVEFVSGGRCLAIVQPPGPSIGQDAPIYAGAGQVVDDLERGVGVAELVPRVIPAQLAQGTLPVLGVGDRQGTGVEGGLIRDMLIGLLPSLGVGEQGIIGSLHPARDPDRRLGDVFKAQDAERWPDECVLGLALVEVGQDALLPLVQRLQRSQWLAHVVAPLRVLGQPVA